jgi:hypothetical protein
MTPPPPGPSESWSVETRFAHGVPSRPDPFIPERSERKSWRDRLDQFPTQLVLTVAWTVVGIPVCVWLRSSLLWVSLMSVYAIIVSHFTGHLAWRAKREAQERS